MHNILDLVFDWLVFGFGVPILIGTGFTLLADEFRQFRAARVCFTVAAVWLFGKVAMWGILTSEKFSIRAGVTALVCAIVGVGLVEAIRLTANRETEAGRIESTQTSAPTVPPVVAPDTRQFTNRTPRELLDFYKNVTTLQGDSLLAPFKGLWIKATGKVESVLGAGGTQAQVVLKDHEGAMCSCTFHPRWTDALRRLSKNDEISVTGKIAEGQNGSTLFLADCDLGESSSASTTTNAASTSPALQTLKVDIPAFMQVMAVQPIADHSTISPDVPLWFRIVYRNGGMRPVKNVFMVESVGIANVGFDEATMQDKFQQRIDDEIRGAAQRGDQGDDVGVGHERIRTFKLNPLSAIDATGLMNGQRVMYFSTYVEWVDDTGKKGRETTCQWLGP